MCMVGIFCCFNLLTRALVAGFVKLPLPLMMVMMSWMFSACRRSL